MLGQLNLTIRRRLVLQFAVVLSDECLPLVFVVVVLGVSDAAAAHNGVIVLDDIVALLGQQSHGAVLQHGQVVVGLQDLAFASSQDVQTDFDVSLAGTEVVGDTVDLNGGAVQSVGPLLQGQGDVGGSAVNGNIDGQLNMSSVVPSGVVLLGGVGVQVGQTEGIQNGTGPATQNGIGLTLTDLAGPVVAVRSGGIELDLAFEGSAGSNFGDLLRHERYGALLQDCQFASARRD